MNMKVLVSGHMTTLPLIDSNIKTVWVEITGKIIKRHRRKHRVEEIVVLADPFAPLLEGQIIRGVPWYAIVWDWIIRLFREIA